MKTAFNNGRTGTFVSMINNKNRMVFQMLDNLSYDILTGSGKRTELRLAAWREAYEYCAARSIRSIYIVQLERRLQDIAAAA